MELVPDSVEKLIGEFSRLPGIGPKTAERLTFYLLRQGSTENFGRAVLDLKEGIRLCSTCANLTTSERCAVCENPERDQTVIAIVEEPLDIIALEKTGIYHGLYHVLHGVISPIDGVGPEDLQIKSLLERLQGGVREVILATNPDLESETTAMYIAKQIEPLGIKVTRLARGLPVGGDLEYADMITLSRALEGRREF